MNTFIMVAMGFVCLLMLAQPIVQLLFNRKIAKEKRYLREPPIKDELI